MRRAPQKLKEITGQIIIDNCSVLKLQLRPTTDSPDNLYTGGDKSCLDINIFYCLQMLCKSKTTPTKTILRSMTVRGYSESQNEIHFGTQLYKNGKFKDEKEEEIKLPICNEKQYNHGYIDETPKIWDKYIHDLQEDKSQKVVFNVGSLPNYTLTINFHPNFFTIEQIEKLFGKYS